MLFAGLKSQITYQTDNSSFARKYITRSTFGAATAVTGRVGMICFLIGIFGRAFVEGYCALTD
jgi:hypothetical protein